MSEFVSHRNYKCTSKSIDSWFGTSCRAIRKKYRSRPISSHMSPLKNESFFSEIICPTLRPIPFALSRSYGNGFGDKATHTCNLGYTIPHADSKEITLTCNYSGQWYPKVTGCERT